MSRKLILLNLALLSLAAWLGWTLRQHWLDARAHERAFFEGVIRARIVAPPPPIAPPGSVAAIQYLDVASHMLFAADRNPNVIIEPPKAAPPPPPMPPLPSYYGQMAIGQPTILLSAVNTPQKSYHAGDKIGPFEIVAFDRQKVTFKWNDQSVERKVDELTPKEGSPELTQQPTAQMTQVVPGSQPSTPVKSLGGSSSDLSGRSESKVGDNISGTDFKTCVPGDTSPEGTVVGDYRKKLTQTLMGKSCIWEKVK